MKKRMNRKGFTLIELLAVIIILAMITINFLFGENGLIKMSQKVRNEYEEAAKNNQTTNTENANTEATEEKKSDDGVEEASYEEK